MTGEYERFQMATEDSGKVNEVKAHGPVPSNYIFRRRELNRGQDRNYGAIYTEKTSQKNTSEHPCSPTNREEGWPIAEEGYQPVPDVGAVQVPFTYNTKDWKWKFHETWADAAAAALTSSDVLIGQQPPKPKDVMDAGEQLQEAGKIIDWLYHPCDRDSVVYQDEDRCASVVREKGGRSLIIVTPEIPSNAERWNKFWDDEDRPKLYARWSTGSQGLLKPIILGCLPVWNEWKSKQALWYTLEPLGSFRTDWNQNFNSLEDVPCLQGLRIDTKILKHSHIHWTLATAHRSYVMNLSNIPKNGRGEPRFGSWIQQQLDHMTQCFQSRKRTRFSFDKNKDYSGNGVNWTQLSAIVMAQQGSRYHAKLWTESMDAYIAYRLDQNDDNWMEFSRKTKKATDWPDWPYPQ